MHHEFEHFTLIALRMNTSISLTWDGFEERAPFVMRQLREDNEFTDVSLGMDDGQKIRAHRVILSSCSPFFKNMLSKHAEKNPLIYLVGIPSSVVQSIVDFIYIGKCNVLENNLEDFVRVGKQFCIPGIADVRLINMDEHCLPEEVPHENSEVILEDKESHQQINTFDNDHFSETFFQDILENSLGANSDFLNQLGNILDKDDLVETNVIYRETGNNEPETPEVALTSDTITNADESAAHQEETNRCINQNPSILGTERSGHGNYSNSMLINPEESLSEIVKELVTTKEIKVENSNKFSKKKPKSLELKYTVERVTRSKGLVCDMCDFKTKRSDHLTQHKEGKHFGSEYTCSQCDFKAGYRSQLNRHNAEKHLGQKFACESCVYETARQDNFKNHRCRRLRIKGEK